MLLTGCGGSGDTAAEDGDGGSADGGQVPRPSIDAPPGTEPEAVTPYIANLLVAHDRSLNEIIADSTVADDPGHPTIERFLSLWHMDRDETDDLLAQWRERGESGYRTEPFSADHPSNETRLDGAVETVSADEVRFPFCTTSRHRVIDAGGDVVEEIPRLDQPGEGVAVRVGGEWRLDALDVSTNVVGCDESESGDGTGDDEPERDDENDEEDR